MNYLLCRVTLNYPVVVKVSDDWIPSKGRAEVERILQDYFSTNADAERQYEFSFTMSRYLDSSASRGTYADAVTLEIEEVKNEAEKVSKKTRR